MMSAGELLLIVNRGGRKKTKYRPFRYPAVAYAEYQIRETLDETERIDVEGNIIRNNLRTAYMGRDRKREAEIV